MVGDYAVTRVNLSMGTWHFPSNHWFFYKVVEYQKFIVMCGRLTATSEPAQPQCHDDHENKNIKKVTDLIAKQIL